MRADKETRGNVKRAIIGKVTGDASMFRSDDIHRMEITCTESDEYTIDIGFSFISMNEKAYLVDGICAENDIFEVKAHTLAKMLARSITLPRTIRFGFSENDARHVAFASAQARGNRFCWHVKHSNRRGVEQPAKG